jgi:hypothetical protein
MRSFGLFLITLMFATQTGWSAPPTPVSSPAPPPEKEELAAVLKTLLLAAMPEPLIEDASKWGSQRMVTVGYKWERDGLLLKPEKQKEMRNDGTWRKVQVVADNPGNNLIIEVRNLQQPAKGKLTFDLIVRLKTRIRFEQQLWKGGTRLYSGETRARCEPVLVLKCESTTRVQKTDSFLPDIYFRLRVLDAKLNYDNLVVEHTAGIGGEVAKAMGEASLSLLKQLKPSFEKKMLEKANQAIIKVGDTKEVKLGLGKLLK